MNVTDIDKEIVYLIDKLKAIQNSNGGFETFFKQPYYNPDKGWMKFPDNAVFDTAWGLIPLLNIKTETARQILNKGVQYLLTTHNFKQKLWSYPILSKEYLHFYDLDSTALSAYVLNAIGKKIANKQLLDELIIKNNYPVFVYPKKYLKTISLVDNISLYWHNTKVKKGAAFKRQLMHHTDTDVAVTFNTLLYMGKTSKNRTLVERVLQVIHQNTYNSLYYPTRFHVFYCMGRLKSHTQVFSKETIKIIEHQIQDLYNLYWENSEQINRILLLNTIYTFGLADAEKYSALEDEVWMDIKESRCFDLLGIYSSNIKTDTQPGTNLPNTYFGSPAITCSLYLEFLNLYRKRFYGKYYGEE